MTLVAQDADDFRGEGFIQQRDHRLHVGLVARCHGAALNPLPCPGPKRLHIGQTGGFFDDSFLSESAGLGGSRLCRNRCRCFHSFLLPESVPVSIMSITNRQRPSGHPRTASPQARSHSCSRFSTDFQSMLVKKASM